MIRTAVSLTRCSLIISSLLLVGCASMDYASTWLGPYFSCRAGEFKLFQSFAKKQESVALEMRRIEFVRSCVLYARVLGLYESREIAEKYFGKVVAVAPKSQLAASSKAWLKLLQKTTPGTDHGRKPF